jgi:hypothetical protein
MKHFFIYASALVIIAGLAAVNFWAINTYKAAQLIRSSEILIQHNTATTSPSGTCGISENSCQTSAATTTSENQSVADGVAAEIKIDSPTSNQLISSPLKISGQALGGWYFEGSFPIQLIGDKGEVLATAQATAQSDWTSPEFVSFKAKLDFDAGSSTIGMLVFSNDNPSGLPQNQKQFGIPVRFGK